MKENELIINLFTDLFEGSPWIEVNIMDSLNSISIEMASNKPSASQNSIWEILNHMINWRLNVLKRVQGDVIETANNNYFELVADTSQKAWESTLKRLRESQVLWLEFLKDLKSENLSNLYAKNNMTYFEHIHGIIQHDAYHLGQIRLLAKQANIVSS